MILFQLVDYKFPSFSSVSVHRQTLWQGVHVFINMSYIDSFEDTTRQ
jgi:hypothetical protein